MQQLAETLSLLDTIDMGLKEFKTTYAQLKTGKKEKKEKKVRKKEQKPEEQK